MGETAIERTAGIVEACSRAALAVLALAVNVAVIWHFWGTEIRAWWKRTFPDRWAETWRRRWELQTDAND